MQKRKYESLRGRIVVELISRTHVRESGFIIVDRKNVAEKGKVVAVGSDSMNVKGKPIRQQCKVGDIVYFKAYKPLFHKYDRDGMKQGTCTIWLEDILAIESED